MDAANKPGRGPVQPEWASAARLHQSARLSAQSWIIRAGIRVNGRNGPPFPLATRRRVRDVRDEAALLWGMQPLMGTDPWRAAQSEGADDEPEARSLW
jgi:hypothetical protein